MPSRGQTITLAYTAWDTVANAGKTGDVANHTLRWVKDGTSSGPTNAPAEVDAANAPGTYKLVLTATECTCDSGTLSGKSSTAGVSIIPISTTFEQLPTAAANAAGGIPTIGTGAGQISVDGAGNIDANVLKWASQVVPTPSVTGVPKVDVWYWVGNDQGVDSFGIPVVALGNTYNPVLHAGVAQAGGAGTITLAAAASADNNAYVGATITLYGGAGLGQSRRITAYNGTTKVATVDANWGTNTATGSQYTVMRTWEPKLDSSLRVTALDSTGTAFTYVTPSTTGAIAAAVMGDVSDTVGADVVLIKAVTDRVNTMLAASGGNWTYTVDALKNAPFGPPSAISVTGNNETINVSGSTNSVVVTGG